MGGGFRRQTAADQNDLRRFVTDAGAGGNRVGDGTLFQNGEEIDGRFRVAVTNARHLGVSGPTDRAGRAVLEDEE